MNIIYIFLKRTRGSTDLGLTSSSSEEITGLKFNEIVIKFFLLIYCASYSLKFKVLRQTR